MITSLWCYWVYLVGLWINNQAGILIKTSGKENLMFGLFFRRRNHVVSTIIRVMPVLIFILTLAVKIPYSFSQVFLGYSVVLFLALLLIYYLVFCLPGKWGWLAGFILTMLLFGLTLSYYWTFGFSNNKVMAGFLPYKDGESYYGGAEMLLNALPIPAAGLQADGRPLFPGLLATLLFLTQHNLQRSLAILVGMVGVFCYLSARQVFNSWGTLPAALYILLLYFYIQPLISTTLSELPGLAFGCLGFILLWRAARALNVRDLVFGLVMLMLGISIRAGAFFIFPMLICWAGWVFRGETRFSYRVSAIALITVLGAFLVFNILYPRLVVEAGSATLCHLAYAFYGQVLGGAGWHRAITDLETRDALVVYQAAFDFFLKHPLSLFIGIAKSYRDFFVPNSTGIFSFVSLEGMTGQDILFWILGLGLLIGGIVRSCREIGSALPALLFAAFLGVFLSIPFLPPVDGGHRFYAGTMPFFFALLAYAVDRVLKNSKMSVKADLPGTPLQVVSVLVFVLVLPLPVLIQRLSIPVSGCLVPSTTRQRILA